MQDPDPRHSVRRARLANMPSAVALAHLAMLFVTVTFSLWNVLGKMVLKRGLDPVVLAFYRETLTAALLIAGCLVAQRRSGRRPKRPTAREAVCFLLCGCGGVFALQLFYIIGLTLTSADTGAIMQPVTPVLVLMLAAALGLERLTLCACSGGLRRRTEMTLSWIRVAGVALASGGCALLVEASRSGAGSEEGSSGEAGGSSLLGVGCLLLSDVGAATFILSQKPLFASYDPSVVIAASYGIGASCMAVVGLVWKGGEPALWSLDGDEAAVLTFVILICGVADYALMTWANQHLEATVLALYGVLQPLVTACLAFLIVGERVAPVAAAAAALIIAGFLAVAAAERLLAPPPPDLGRKLLGESAQHDHEGAPEHETGTRQTSAAQRDTDASIDTAAGAGVVVF